MTTRIDRIVIHRVPVTWRTTWVFAEVGLDDGAVGWGEPSDAHAAELAAIRWPELTDRYVGMTVKEALAQVTADVAAAALAAPPRALPADITLLGGFEQALCDLAAQQAGMPLSQWLGADGTRDSIPLYANINRGVRARTTDEFARVARAAVDEGFTAIKCAPFDFLVGDRRVDTGLRLVEAVREEVGPDVELMLDAHHYVTLDEMVIVADRLEALELRWIEDVAFFDDPAMVRRAREIVDIPQAAGEFATRDEEIRTALDTGALDVFMPDVKHAGGDLAAKRLGDIATRAGYEVSLHNPTGPVGMAHSVAASMAMPTARVLECAYGEVPWRQDLLSGVVERNGVGVAQTGPGLGVTVNRDELRRRCAATPAVGWAHPGPMPALDR